jgi:hypothetical protein
MFQVLVLVCSTSLSPSDCQKTTALDVFLGPKVPNEMICGFHGQAFLAQTSLGTRGPNEYVKIRCTRLSDGQAAWKGR